MPNEKSKKSKLKSLKPKSQDLSYVPTESVMNVESSHETVSSPKPLSTLKTPPNTPTKRTKFTLTPDSSFNSPNKEQSTPTSPTSLTPSKQNSFGKEFQILFE